MARGVRFLLGFKVYPFLRKPDRVYLFFRFCPIIFRADGKKECPPQNVDIKGDTAFRRPRGLRRTCGRWHQSNGPAGCMRFHGTLVSIYSPSLLEQPNAQRPVVQARTLLSKKPNVRTGNITDLRSASVCFIQEESHNIPCILNGGGRIQVIGTCRVTTDYTTSSCSDELMWEHQHSNNSCYSSSSSAENAASKTLCAQCHAYTVLYTRTAVVVVVDANNEVPVPGINSRYYTHDDIRVHIKGACFTILDSPPTTLGWPGLQSVSHVVHVSILA